MNRPTIDRPADDDATVNLTHPPASGAREGGSDGLIENALPAGTRLGEFEVRGIIGCGGFSIVYLAWDHSLHRNVALKEYIPAELAMRDSALRVTIRSQRHRETFEVGLKSFINEARLLANFDHPALVKVHRFWEDRGTAFMVMPRYQGATLKDALAARREPPDQVWLLRFLEALTEALQVLHSQNCFHRDIAPDNIILVEPNLAPLLLDFGAARQVVGSLTHDLTAILKKGYAPLEQYGEIPGMRQGPWTDIYALAAVVHYAIRGFTPPPAVGRVINDTYERLQDCGLSGYSKQFLAAIDAALSVRPDARPQSIVAFRRELGLDRQNDARIVPGANPDRSSPAPPGRRYPWLLGAAAMAAAVIAVLGLAWVLLAPAQPSKGDGLVKAVAPRITEAKAPAIVETSASQVVTPAPAPKQAEGPSLQEVQAQTAAKRAAELEARRKAESLIASIRQLAESEKRDARPLIARAQAKRDEAEKAVRDGRFEEATSYDDQSADEARTSLNLLADELVTRYSRLADQATQANQFEIAQQALTKAKKVEKYKTLGGVR